MTRDSIAPASRIRVTKLVAAGQGAAIWREIEEIFFLSTTATGFAEARHKQDFFQRWTAYYREQEPERIFLALNRRGHVLGYLTGCADSRAAERLYGDIAYYGLFEDLFASYPAHLHINCHPEHRGRGIGSRLIGAFLADLRRDAVPGVHLVTVPGSRNVRFYQRCGFDVSIQRPWKTRELLFLGRTLG